MNTGTGTALVLAPRVVRVGSTVEVEVAVAAGIHHSNPEADIDIRSADILCHAQEV